MRGISPSTALGSFGQAMGGSASETCEGQTSTLPSTCGNYEIGTLGTLGTLGNCKLGRYERAMRTYNMGSLYLEMRGTATNSVRREVTLG
jgi:hypothetical protein